jgi:DNA-binding response OmpR family regulator
MMRMHGAAVTRANPIIALSDDEPTFAELYAAVLEHEGYRIVAMSDKRDLLSQLNVIRPDLVITDIYSPGMDGLTFLKSAKVIPETRDIPVIVATLHGEHMNEALSLGAYDFLAKPFEIEEFLNAVKAALFYSPWTDTEN